MADVDDELLALVGGDESSDDEGSEQAMNISKSESGSPEPEEKNSAKKAPSKKPKKDFSDEEEGEASSDAASVASQESAPMDESDSDAASAAGGNVLDEEEDKYPYEGMYTNEEEKEHIMGLREVERESILAERMHDIQLQRQNRLLRQLVSQNESDKKAAKKRKANDAELEEAQRKTSRQRTKVGGAKVGETSSGIESLRRARAERQDRKRRFDEDRERNKDKATSATRDSPDDDDDDRDNDSDVEWNGRNRRSRSSHTPEVKESPPAELRDIERVRLSRSRFAQICFFPGFEDAMKGCFVRICIGPDSHGANVYRMAVIKGFATGKPYAMEKPNGQSFVTDQYIIAAHGKAEREWPFIACSESEFTEAEFNRYKVTAQADSVVFPKKSALNDKIDDINKLRGRSWTDRELDEKLQRERELRKKFAPAERNRLVNSIEEAKARGDHEKAGELQQKLDTLETPRLAFRTSLTPHKKASPAVSQQDRLAQLNAENRRRNAEAVRKAQLKEKAKARETPGSRAARGEQGNGDVSQRKSAQPKDSTPASSTSTPANGTPKPDAAASKPIPPHIAQLQQNQSAILAKKGIPQIHRPLVDDDIIGALDLEIDVEID